MESHISIASMLNRKHKILTYGFSVSSSNNKSYAAGGLAEGTKIKAEILALIKALEYVNAHHDSKKISIYTHQFPIRQGLDILPTWIRTNFETFRKGLVYCQDFWLQIRELIQDHEIKLEMSSDEPYEIAKFQARLAMLKRRKELGMDPYFR